MKDHKPQLITLGAYIPEGLANKEVHVSMRKYRERSQESSIRRACLFLKLHVSEDVETNLC